MEVTQFYLHLPSNSSLDKFPHNTLTEYRVSLPQTLNLTGEWEVALTEIHYPHSWNNIQQFRFYVRNEKLYGVWDSLEMLPGHYSSTEDILSKMKELVDNENRYTDEERFSYDNLSRKVTVHFQQRRSLAKWYGLYAGVHPRTNYFKDHQGGQTSGFGIRLSRSFRLLWSYSVIICWRCTGPFASNCSRRRRGWPASQ